MSKGRLNVLLILSILAFPLTQGLLSPFLNTISQVYHLDYQQTGFIFTFFYIGFMVSSLTIGYISDKFGVRVIIWGLLLNSIASAFIFASNSYIFFIASVILLGVSLGVEDILCASSLALINPQKSGFYVNISQFVACMGGIVIPLAAGYMVQNNINWKYAYIVSGILIFILFAFLYKEPFPRTASTMNINLKAVASLIRDKRVLILGVTFFCIFSIEGGLLGWLGVYMTKIYQVSDFLSGLSISLMYLAIGASRLIIAFLSHRVKHVNLIFASSLLSAVLLAVALLSGNFIMALVFFFLAMFSSAGIFTSTIILTNDLFPDYTGTMLSLTFSAGTVGAMIVPGLIGTIAQNVSLKAGISVLVYLYIIIMLLFAYLKFGKQKIDL